MEITGNIKEVFDIETFEINGDQIKKQQIVLTTQEQYPQDLPIEFFRDKIDLLADLKKGQRSKIFFNLKGRKSKKDDRYFVSLQGWRVEKLDASDASSNYSSPSGNTSYGNADNSFDDLPF